MKRVLPALLIALAACSPPAQDDAPMPIEGGPQAAEAPPEVLAAIQAEDATFAPTEAIEDATTGARAFEVAGSGANGEVTYHLMHFNEGWRIVGIRRDIAWGDAPASVRDVVATSPTPVTPARIVEVREPGADGVMYELWTANPESLAMTVRAVEGGAAIMPAPH